MSSAGTDPVRSPRLLVMLGEGLGHYALPVLAIGLGRRYLHRTERRTAQHLSLVPMLQWQSAVLQDNMNTKPVQAIRGCFSPRQRSHVRRREGGGREAVARATADLALLRPVLQDHVDALLGERLALRLAAGGLVAADLVRAVPALAGVLPSPLRSSSASCSRLSGLCHGAELRMQASMQACAVR